MEGRIFCCSASQGDESLPDIRGKRSIEPWEDSSRKRGPRHAQDPANPTVCPFVLDRPQVVPHNRTSPWDSVPRRHYYVDRYQVLHFKPRGSRRWLQNPRNVLIVVLVGSGVAITVYSGNLETVPYTKRSHFVVLSRDMERRMGEARFSQIKNSLKGKILPAIHPQSIRVRLISKDIIDALQRGLSHGRRVLLEYSS